MPGSLLEGYLRAQEFSQQEEELAEEKKRRKLEESLDQLRLKQLTRQMSRAAEEWKYQQRQRAEIGQLMEGLSPEEKKSVLLGLKLPEIKKESEPEWVGTPWEEAYRRKETYIKPETDVSSLLKATTKEHLLTLPKAEKKEIRKTAQQFIADWEEQEWYRPSEAPETIPDEVLQKYAKEAYWNKWKKSLLPEDRVEVGKRLGFYETAEPIEGIRLPTEGFVPEEPTLTLPERPVEGKSEEDDFIAQARGKKVNWDLVARDHPDWDFDYIFEQLGLR